MDKTIYPPRMVHEFEQKGKPFLRLVFTGAHYELQSYYEAITPPGSRLIKPEDGYRVVSLVDALDLLGEAVDPMRPRTGAPNPDNQPFKAQLEGSFSLAADAAEHAKNQIAAVGEATRRLRGERDALVAWARRAYSHLLEHGGEDAWRVRVDAPAMVRAEDPQKNAAATAESEGAFGWAPRAKGASPPGVTGAAPPPTKEPPSASGPSQSTEEAPVPGLWVDIRKVERREAAEHRQLLAWARKAAVYLDRQEAGADLDHYPETPGREPITAMGLLEEAPPTVWREE